jgi:hypothetical protein
MASPRKADASPTKAFFVRMLTRDITLDDCILDLVDNSVDGAWEHTRALPSELVIDDSLQEYQIDIDIDVDKFRITDNCGGITLDEAVNYAFTFGRKSTEPPPAEYTIGVYGIGMKRAVFKLGKNIQITSTYSDDGRRIGFAVPIDVDEWVSTTEGPWDFDLVDSEPAEAAGVEIEVTNLAPEISEKFKDPTYVRSLRDLLGRDYLLSLMRGLAITVNGVSVTSQPLSWREEFAPLRRTYEDSGVTVSIIAGMHAPPPDDIGPQAPSRTDRISGWYIICNGRVVLAADRSSVTGWGSRLTWPSWHGQYNGFLGVAFFNAADPTLLPMTTTKRSVDTSSAVYVRALVEMEKPTRAWIDYTNVRKNDREAAARLERSGKSVTISNVQPNDEFKPPTLGQSRDPVANVNYTVLRRRMTKMAAALGNIGLTYREVGLRTFDYAYEQLVDEDDG